MPHPMLVYPTLDLFLYDLRDGLNQTEGEIQANRQYFQQRIPPNLQANLFQHDNAAEVEYLELLSSRYSDFTTTHQGQALSGYYYPVRLNDVYGLQVDLSVDNLTDPQPTDSFDFLQTAIKAQINNIPTGTIGQTWMISGWLPPNPTASASDIARSCYQALMAQDGNWEYDLQGQGTLLGATVFELWRYRLTFKENTPPSSHQPFQDSQHVLICLYPNQATAAKAADLYYLWLRVFAYRNKILWAYGQSRLLKESLKGGFRDVIKAQKYIETNRSQSATLGDFKKTLSEVQTALQLYSENLINLDFQSRTIDINVINYKKRLQSIQTKAKIFSPSLQLDPETSTDLTFLEEFIEITNEKYLLQIHKDSENMQLGLKYLEDTINAVRGRLEIEKAERDRDFQRIATLVATAWAISSNASKNISKEVSQGVNQKIQDRGNNSETPPLSTNQPVINCKQGQPLIIYKEGEPVITCESSPTPPPPPKSQPFPVITCKQGQPLIIYKEGKPIVTCESSPKSQPLVELGLTLIVTGGVFIVTMIGIWLTRYAWLRIKPKLFSPTPRSAHSSTNTD